MAAAPTHDDFRFEYDQVQRARLRRRVLSREQVHTPSIALLISFGCSAFTIFAYGWVFVDA